MNIAQSSQLNENFSQFDITGGDLEGITEGVGLSESVVIVGISYQLEDGVQSGEALSISGSVVVTDSMRTSEVISSTASLVTQTDTFIDQAQDANYL